MMTHKELKTKALADPETMAEHEAQKPAFELLDKLLEGKKRAGSRLKHAPACLKQGACRDDGAVDGID